MSSLEWAVNSAQRRGLVPSAFKETRESIQRGPRHIITDTDGVLIVFGSKAIAKICAVECSVPEGDHIHSHKMPGQALQKARVNASLQRQSLRAEAVLSRIFQVFEKVDINTKTNNSG